MVAGLIDEPYHLSIDVIADLTPRQVDFLYYRPRDKKTGAAKPLPYLFAKEQSNKLQEKAQFLSMGLSMGHKLEDLETQWKQYYPEDN